MANPFEVTRSENVISRLLSKGNSVYSGFTLLKSNFPANFLHLVCVCQSIMEKGLSDKRTVHEGNAGGT